MKQIVNGTPKSLGAAGDPPSSVDPIVPELHNEHRDVKQSLKKIFDQQGPEAFAKVGHALAILTLVYVMC